jgi:hypothetical protein
MQARVATLPPNADLRALAQQREGTARALALVHRADGRILWIRLFADERAAPSEGDPYAVATEDLRPGRAPRCARVGRHEGRPLRDVSPAPLVGIDGLAGWLMLIDRRSGEGLGILLFESEETLRRGDEFVTNADPGTAGPTSSVDFYDVAFVS